MKAPPCFATAVCRARDLLNELQIQAPEEIAIESIAPFKGAAVRYAELAGCDGQMMRSGDKAVITVRRSIDREGQRRFVIAHELGHFLLHPSIRQIDEVDEKQTVNFSHKQEPAEMEANYFAAELLMPKALFEKDARQVEVSWDGIHTLAERFKTTLTSTAIQFVHCTREAVMLVASDQGERRWFVISDYAREFFLRDELRVHRYTCAHELLAENKTRSRAANIPAGAWFNDFDPDGKEFITEDAMRARNSNFVLSLLWIHEAI